MKTEVISWWDKPGTVLYPEPIQSCSQLLNLFLRDISRQKQIELISPFSFYPSFIAELVSKYLYL
jgi:hypothetical protein